MYTLNWEIVLFTSKYAQDIKYFDGRDYANIANYYKLIHWDMAGVLALL